jgi:hypothetical protein
VVALGVHLLVEPLHIDDRHALPRGSSHRLHLRVRLRGVVEHLVEGRPVEVLAQRSDWIVVRCTRPSVLAKCLVQVVLTGAQERRDRVRTSGSGDSFRQITSL